MTIPVHISGYHKQVALRGDELQAFAEAITALHEPDPRRAA